MLLMIDNYDSFTYNLVQYFAELGETVVIKRNDEVTIEEIRALMPSYIVISPGPCTPKEAGISNIVIQSFAGEIPILGVCLGHQCIGEAFGATVRGARKIMHGKVSSVQHHNTGIFRGLDNPLTVTRYHSLVIDVETLSDDFEVNAWTKDDDEVVVMGIQHRRWPLVGVQFHPESFMTTQGRQLLANFLSS